MAQMDLLSGELQDGKIVGGKYRLGGKLSEGGGGIVWRATDPKDRSIALKFLKWSPLKSRKTAAERFKNEFAILKSLSHPNISKIYDFGLDHDTDMYFFTTELLTAGDLGKLVKAPIPVIEELLIQSLRALEYLSNHKLLHLDIKPQNLLLREESEHPTLALIDFGLATFRPPDRPGGTPNFMPPELIVKRLHLEDFVMPPPDHRSDLYSLGITFYYCLTGVQPFCALLEDGIRLDTAQTLKNHLSITPPPPSTLRGDVPPYLDRIIMKLMARCPDDRYASALVAAQALQYSSPRQRRPESKQSLLAYLPKEGKIVGRHHELVFIESWIASASKGERQPRQTICIAAGGGTGRSRLLKAVKPIAQQMEMTVSLFDDDNEPNVRELGDIINDTGQRKRLLLIDDIDRLIELHMNGGSTIRDDIMTLVRKIRFQSRLPGASGSMLLMMFTINTDRSDLKSTLARFGIDDAICHVLNIENFTNSEVSEYLEALLGEPPDKSVVEQLISCTGGNPLFITEHLENMIARGNLFSLAGRPDAKTLKTIGIDFSRTAPPTSLEQATLNRLDGLSEGAKNLALTLACWDHPTSASEIRLGDRSQLTGEHLLELLSSGVIRKHKDDSRFEFANSLSPQIIADHTDPELLAKRHDEIATYIKSKRKPKREELELHAAYGTPTAKTIPALKHLAECAAEKHKPTEAILHLQKLLRNLHNDDWKECADVLMRIGELHEGMHHPEDAKSFYSKLMKFKAPRDHAKELKLKALERIGRMEIRRRNLRQASRIFNDALKIVGKSKQMAPWRIRIENFLGGIDLRNGDIEKAIERFERTNKVAKKILTRSERQAIMNNELGEALLRHGDVKRALTILQKELKAAERSGDPRQIANHHYLIANTLRHDSLRKYGEANKHYTEGLEIAAKHHLANLQIRLQNGLGNLFLLNANPNEAMVHYREGFRLSQHVDSITTSVELMIGMGLAASAMADPDGTIECLEAALDFSGGPKGAAAGLIRRYRPTIYITLGDAYYQKNDLVRATEYLEKVRSIDGKEPLTPDLRYSLYGTLTEIAMAYEDYATARKHLPTLRAIAKSFPPARKHLAHIEEKLKAI